MAVSRDKANERYLRSLASREQSGTRLSEAMQSRQAGIEAKQQGQAPGNAALGGAAMGSKFGPWGAAIGAGAGHTAARLSGAHKERGLKGLLGSLVMTPLALAKMPLDVAGALGRPGGLQAGMGLAGNLAGSMPESDPTPGGPGSGARATSLKVKPPKLVKSEDNE